MNKKTLSLILRYVRPSAGLLVLAVACAAGGVALSLWTPVLIGGAVDLIAGAASASSLPPVLLKIALAAAGSAALSLATTRLTNRVAYRTARRMRTDAFDRLQSVPLSYTDGHAHGDIISRVVNDVDQVSDGLLHGFAQLFTGVATIAGTLLFMLFLNPSVALTVVLITPVSLLAAWFIAKRASKTFAVQMEQRGELGGFVEEMVSNQKVLRAFSREPQAQQRFEEINARMYESGVRSQFYSSVTNPATRFVNALVYAGAGIAGALSVIVGGLSVGQLSSFLIYAGQYTKPFNEVSGVITELQAALAAARRVFELIDARPEEGDAPDAAPWEDCEGSVRVEDVAFSYTPGKKLIEGLCFAAAPGQRVAIVGPTGSGKTTVVNLLMRFYDAQGGRIRMDGTDIRAITKDSMRGLYGMVLQETWILTGSVRQNVAFGRPDATEGEIVEAAKAAGAHSFIRRLPRGYDTVLSERDISQGQKQLLCIARVMLARPRILILDEATSSIDTRTELKIQAAFLKMMEGRTSFIVAHRLSTVREADVILVLRDGVIVEQGGHDALLKKNGFYAQLYRAGSE